MLGLHERVTFFWRAVARRMTLPVYLSSLLLGTLGLVAWLLLLHGAGLTGGPATDTGLTLLGAALMLFPASAPVVALVNRLISESARPQHLPRLALANGIPAEHRVLVVIPAMLTSLDSIHDLVHRLQLHYLANPERHAQFALLTDWADADTAHCASDAALLTDATQQVCALNVRVPGTAEVSDCLLYT